jgi:hypothetical protein
MEPIKTVAVDARQGFLFLHDLLCSTIAAIIDDKHFQQSFFVGQNLVNKELAAFKNFVENKKILTQADLNAYFEKTRIRFLQTLEAMQIKARPMPVETQTEPENTNHKGN